MFGHFMIGNELMDIIHVSGCLYKSNELSTYQASYHTQGKALLIFLLDYFIVCHATTLIFICILTD